MLYLVLGASIACTAKPTPSTTTDWTTLSVPIAEGVLMSGVRSATDVVHVVGGYPGHGFLLNRIDDVWSVHSTYDEMLHWVHRVNDKIWAVGASGLITHLNTNGTAVPHSDPMVDEELWGVFAIAEDDVWVVGGNPRATGSTEALILHYNGVVWEQISLPELDRPCPALFKVWARNAQDIYFAGANGVLLTYDGSTLEQVPVELGDDLVSIWGNEETVVVVGGRIRGVMLTHKNGAWTTQLLNQTSGLNGIWVGAQSAVAVGHQGTTVKWMLNNPESIHIAQPVSTLLHGIFESAPEQFIAIGGTLDQPQPWQPMMIETQP